MNSYDVSANLSINLVVRGAANKSEARKAAQALIDAFVAANSDLLGHDYGQPLVSSFSVSDPSEEIDVDKLDD